MEDAEPQPPPRRRGEALAEMTFSGLVLSLSASAMVHLGEPEAEAKEPVEPDLPLARQTIEILELLARKTRGNLEADEQQLLENVLHQLRLRYVARSRA